MLLTIFLLYVGMVCLIIPGLKIRQDSKDTLLTKQDSNYIKGLAAIGVLLAHLQDFLEYGAGEYSLFLRPFSFLGGMGVLLFFFTSGYGIFRGYAKKTPTIRYWKNRIINVMLPAFAITMLTVIAVDVLDGRTFQGLQFFTDLMTTQWYIIAAIIMYLVFFLSWCIARGRMLLLMILDMIGCLLVIAFFYAIELPSRWYTGLLLFPTGMLVAWIEERMLCLEKKIIVVSLVISFLFFAITGLAFVHFKGTNLGNCMKTVSGICLALLIVFFVQLFEVGNRVIRWLGDRSLYIYLCHVGILSVASILANKMGLLGGQREIWVYIILAGTFLYAGVCYVLFGKLGQLLNNQKNKEK